MMKKGTDRLVVALDLPTADEAIKLVDTLGDLVQYYQVGMQQFYGMGHTIMTQLASRNKKLLLDLKLHDIPTTVGRSVTGLCQFSPSFITLHAAGGVKMLQAGLQAAREWAEQTNNPRPKILAITILTSIGERDWMDLGYQNSIRESVLRMSVMCKEAGIDGVIASPQESMNIRSLCGPDFIIATPGIRLFPQNKGDQKRTATPAEALRGGSDYLIVGRPIITASDPLQVVKNILTEMCDKDICD